MNKAQSVFERTYQEQQVQSINEQNQEDDKNRIKDLLNICNTNLNHFKQMVTHDELQTYKKAQAYDLWMKDQTRRGIKVFVCLTIAIIALFLFGGSNVSSLSIFALTTSAMLSLFWLWYSLMLIFWINTLIQDVISGQKKLRKDKVFLYQKYYS
ncbi:MULTISPECIES: hypothetical protein [Cysteiniphilum]|uniref:Uncharacterized protein n=1 Tax=Cysteiniphilum litorale TaxID=2056700 RepID=A0A8J2Z3Q2_9GAMM|nr:MULTISPECIES: hypothetical protein [Cysteiniphilum]GGF92499.1 hypothetical protein GCM10010995_07070 [Cysteiniphilum litorale]